MHLPRISEGLLITKVNFKIRSKDFNQLEQNVSRLDIHQQFNFCHYNIDEIIIKDVHMWIWNYLKLHVITVTLLKFELSRISRPLEVKGNSCMVWKEWQWNKKTRFPQSFYSLKPVSNIWNTINITLLYLAGKITNKYHAILYWIC